MCQFKYYDTAICELILFLGKSGSTPNSFCQGKFKSADFRFHCFPIQFLDMPLLKYSTHLHSRLNKKKLEISSAA